MKLNENYVLKNVAGNDIVFYLGEDALRADKIITLNETATFIWRLLEDGISTKEEIIKTILDKYEVGEEEAKKSVETFLSTLIENKILCE